jgi:hypothetical protein
MKTATGALEAQFGHSIEMIALEIEACPEELWGRKAGGFPFWQQLLHALCGSLFWLRPSGDGFEEPYPGRRLFPELDGIPEGEVSKAEMRELAESVRSRAARFFAESDDLGLHQPCPAYPGISRLEAICGQLRHLMYHAGACDAALRERGFAAVDYLEPRAG